MRPSSLSPCFEFHSKCVISIHFDIQFTSIWKTSDSASKRSSDESGGEQQQMKKSISSSWGKRFEQAFSALSFKPSGATSDDSSNENNKDEEQQSNNQTKLAKTIPVNAYLTYVMLKLQSMMQGTCAMFTF